ncbi:MAG: hypothetical protein QXM68_01015 [Candidatus Aenigmatarchaeota archaeon]|nr:hypothetical protein [Candidatus Aenigmarchaeota archaeon]
MEKSFWVFLALLIVLLLSYTYVVSLFSIEAKNLLTPIYSSILCAKDENDSYFLSEMTSTEFCENIDSFTNIKDMDCTFVFNEEGKIESCEKIKEFVVLREEDCVNLIFNGKTITSVKNSDMDEVCKKLKN